MEGLVTHTEHLITNQEGRDPTRTTILRAMFVAEMIKRFRHLRMLITRSIVEEDVFGLLEPESIIGLQTPGRRAFNFPRSADKVSQFMAWLQQQVNDGVLQVTRFEQVGESVESAWTNMFIQDSYKRGVIRARSQLVQGGFDVPPLSETGGIGASMAAPFHLDRVGLLYTRTFNELKGITDAMDQMISRVLSQGLADGLSPRVLAKQLNAIIKGTGGDLSLTDALGRFVSAERRATILARTEIIRAHSEAQLQEFENWKVEGVLVKAEFITAGDNRVCFPGFTKVNVHNGETRIDEIKVNDLVLTPNGYQKVIDVMSREYTGQMTALDYEDRSLFCTSEHPIWSNNKDIWINAENMTLDDSVQLNTRLSTKINGILNFIPNDPLEVFDITVEKEHSFYANGILVHNCQQCANLEGSIFTIEEARGIIPVHAQCRCAWIPFLPES